MKKLWLWATVTMFLILSMTTSIWAIPKIVTVP